MALSILDVRIGQVGVEASRAALDGQLPGPLGALGSAAGYEALFEAAKARSGGMALPWLADKPYSNRFWRKYLTDRMMAEAEEQWPAIARGALVPIKASVPLPLVHLHPAEVRSYSEAYAWPNAIGIVWNNWIRPETDVEGLVALLETLRNGEVAWSGPDGAPGKVSMQSLYHRMLDTARDTLWKTEQPGIRSKPMTIVSIVQGSAPPLPDKTSVTAREALLDGILGAWGERPAPLPGDERAASGETVYVADGLRLVWAPGNFLSGSRKRRNSCLHRNLLFSSLQVEMVAASARMLAAYKQSNGDLPSRYHSTRDRLLVARHAFLKGLVYSAPHLRVQLERQSVAESLDALKE